MPDSAVTQSPGYDCPPSTCSAAPNPQPDDCRAQFVGVQGDAGEGLDQLRRRRIAQHPPFPIEHQCRGVVVHREREDRTAERRRSLEPHLARGREAGEDVSAQLLAAGAARETQLRAQRPYRAALGGRVGVRGGSVRERRAAGRWQGRDLAGSARGGVTRSAMSSAARRRRIEGAGPITAAPGGRGRRGSSARSWRGPRTGRRPTAPAPTPSRRRRTAAA